MDMMFRTWVMAWLLSLALGQSREAAWHSCTLLNVSSDWTAAKTTRTTTSDSGQRSAELLLEVPVTIDDQKYPPLRVLHGYTSRAHLSALAQSFVTTHSVPR